jgi:hypothetical protein
MREGGKEAPACGILQFQEKTRRGMAEDRRAAALPEIDKAEAALKVEAEVPGPEDRGKEA